MALIKCPECKKEFFDTDKVCPNCGYKLPTELSNKQIILIIGALAVGIVLIIILAFVIANKED